MTAKLSPLPPVTYPHVQGIDIYHGDGDVQMHALLDDGVQFLYVKATEGTSYTDPAYADNVARARSVGLLVGAYHFFKPGVDPKKQAAYFLQHAPVVKGDLVHCIDSETAGSGVGQQTYDCAKEMKRLTGRWPCIYSGDSFFTDNLLSHFTPPQDFFLWIARYSSHEPAKVYNIWQYSEDGKAAGIAHDLDLNVFKGDLAALKVHCYG